MIVLEGRHVAGYISLVFCLHCYTLIMGVMRKPTVAIKCENTVIFHCENTVTIYILQLLNNKIFFIILYSHNL